MIAARVSRRRRTLFRNGLALGVALVLVATRARSGTLGRGSAARPLRRLARRRHRRTAAWSCSPTTTGRPGSSTRRTSARQLRQLGPRLQRQVRVRGSFHGFNIYDLSDPAAPTLKTSVVCPGGQGDMSVYGNLLFMSVEETRGKIDCTLTPAADHARRGSAACASSTSATSRRRCRSRPCRPAAARTRTRSSRARRRRQHLRLRLRAPPASARPPSSRAATATAPRPTRPPRTSAST